MSDAPITGSQRFSKDSRIRARRDYLAIQNTGLKLASAHFVFFFRPREADAPCRMGLVVSRKVGNAVHRNRIKRLCRQLFRTTHAEVFGRGRDVVILARRGADTLTLESMEHEWRRAMARWARRP